MKKAIVTPEEIVSANENAMVQGPDPEKKDPASPELRTVEHS